MASFLPPPPLPASALPATPPPRSHYDVLVIDSSHLMSRIVHAGGRGGGGDELSYRSMAHNGIPTGGVYGYLKSLRSVIQNLNSSIGSVVSAWDGMPRGLSTRRQALLPTYKNPEHYEDATKTQEELDDLTFYRDQRMRVDEILGMMGIPTINIPRTEGDDIVSFVARSSPGKVLVMSDDKDFLTLVSDKVHVYRAMKGELATPENFQEKYRIKNPGMYLLWTSITAGHDNIPGIKGVGGTTAERLVNAAESMRFADIRAAVDHCKATDSRNRKRYDAILDNWDTVIRNLQLIDLNCEPLTLELAQAIRVSVEGAATIFNEEHIMQRFSDYGFVSYMREFSHWSLPLRKLSMSRLQLLGE